MSVPSVKRSFHLSREIVLGNQDMQKMIIYASDYNTIESLLAVNNAFGNLKSADNDKLWIRLIERDFGLKAIPQEIPKSSSRSISPYYTAFKTHHHIVTRIKEFQVVDDYHIKPFHFIAALNEAISTSSPGLPFIEANFDYFLSSDELRITAENDTNFIKDPFLRSRILKLISKSYISSNNSRVACRILDKAKKSTDLILDISNKCMILCEIANGYHLAHNQKNCENTLKQAEIECSLIKDTHKKDRVVADIANNYRFINSLDDAIRNALLIIDPNLKSSLLHTLANLYQISTHNTNKTLEVLVEARKAAALIDDPSTKDARLSLIAKNFIKLRNYPEAEIAALLIQNEEDKSKILEEISNYFINLKFLSEGARVALEIPNYEKRNSLLHTIATILIHANNFVEAEKIVRLMPDFFPINIEKTMDLDLIAQGYLDAYNLVGADKIAWMLPDFLRSKIIDRIALADPLFYRPLRHNRFELTPLDNISIFDFFVGPPMPPCEETEKNDSPSKKRRIQQDTIVH
jgi:hypothetical protein